MKDYINAKERIERLVQKVSPRKRKGKLTAILLAGVMIAGTGFTCYKIVSNPVKNSKEITFPDDTLPERRARLLNLAEDQLSHARTSEEANGLKAYIQEIEKGVYDYAK